MPSNERVATAAATGRRRVRVIHDVIASRRSRLAVLGPVSMDNPIHSTIVLCEHPFKSLAHGEPAAATTLAGAVKTGDVILAMDLGVPRSTARGGSAGPCWLGLGPASYGIGR